MFLSFSTRIFAGMPQYTLSDLAEARLEVISFFIAAFLVCALLLRRVWNMLAKDWTWMPRMSYRRALAALLVAGLLCYVVLTMISGARELMTPGAWRKSGLTYKLAGAPERQAALEKLGRALADYAVKNGGAFPSSMHDPALPPELWLVPGEGLLMYTYHPGLKQGAARQVIAEEPRGSSDARWRLYTDLSLAQETDVKP